MQLTNAQIALLRHMATGESVTFHPYMGRFNPSDYYHAWHFGRCTAQAKALLKKGLVQKVDVKPISRDHKLILTDAGRKWIAENSAN